MIKLIGVLIVVVGFALKLNTLAVVLIAGIVTGLVSGMDFTSILNILGKSFIDARYMSIFLLSLPVIGLLERNGLRETAAKFITSIKQATPGRILSLWVAIRTLIAALSIRLGGHVQIIRPLIYPMVLGAAQKEGEVSKKHEDKLKAISCATENYGNFYGQNIFIAAGGVLLIVGSLQEAGISVTAAEVSKYSIMAGVAAIILSVIQNTIFDKKLKSEIKAEMKNEKEGK